MLDSWWPLGPAHTGQRYIKKATGKNAQPDGGNRWPAVHRDDAARLFRLAVESAPPGAVLHAVGDERVPIRTIAEVVAAQLGIPAVSVRAEEAGDHLGWLGGLWAIDGPALAQLTRDLLGWQSAGPGLIADLQQGHYFS